MLSATTSLRLIKKVLFGIFFVLAFFVFAQHVEATVVWPDDTRGSDPVTCGELAAPGTYTLTNDIDVGSQTSCFVISSSGVVINPNGHIITANITLQDNGGGSPTWTDNDYGWPGTRTWTFKNSSANEGRVTGETAFYDSSINQTRSQTMLRLGFNSDLSDLFGTSVENMGSVSLDGAIYAEGSGSAFFNGNSYLRVPYYVDLDLSRGNFTLDAWFNTNSFASAQTIFGKDTYGQNQDANLRLVDSNTIEFLTNRANSNLTVTVPTMQTGTWYHIAFVRSSGANTIYLNGAAYGSNQMSITNDSQNYITIGAASWNQPGEFFNGYLDDVRISLSALWTGNFDPSLILSNSYDGVVDGNVTVNYPVARPLGGSVYGTITYVGEYPVLRVGTIFTGACSSNWEDLCNWTDSNGNPAEALPDSSTDVVVNGFLYSYSSVSLKSITFNNGVWNHMSLTVSAKAVFKNGSYNFQTITGNATFNDGSYNYATVTGNAVFNRSYNYQTITGNATFNNDSYNYGTVNGNGAFNCDSYNNGTVVGSITYGPCPAYFWYHDPNVSSSDYWTDASNWYLNPNYSSGDYWVSENFTPAENTPGSSNPAILFGTTSPLVDIDAVWILPAAIDTTGLTGSARGVGVIFNSQNGNWFNAVVTGNITVNGSSYLYGGNVYNDGSSNDYFGNATFNDSTYSYYTTIANNASFHNNAWNYYGTVQGDASFYDNSYNYSSTVNGNAIFYDNSYNYYGTVNGNAIFYDNSINYGTVYGDAHFMCNSQNSGTVYGNIIYNSSCTHALANKYWYHDPNTSTSDSWNDLTNWWNDIDHTAQSDVLPDVSYRAILLGDVAPIVDLDNWVKPESIDATGLTSTANASGVIFTSAIGAASDVGVRGNATFEGYAYNNLNVSGNAIFTASAFDSNNILGANPQQGTVGGSVEFTSLTPVVFTLRNSWAWSADSTAWIFDTAGQNWIFNDSSLGGYNNGYIKGSVVFNGSSYLYGGTISGTTTFNTTYYNNGSDSAVGGVFTISNGAHWSGEVQGTVYGSDNNPITSYVFDSGAVNTGIIYGNATFINGSAASTGSITGNVVFTDSQNQSGSTITGDATFNGNSTNLGTITHNAYVYSPVAKPLGGTVLGTITYIGYPGYYFNDSVTGAGHDGNWNNLSNWWTNTDFNVHASEVPQSFDDVHIYSDVSTSTTAMVSANTANFYGNAINTINLNVVNGTTFNAGSANSGVVTGTTTFIGNDSENLGIVNKNLTSQAGDFTAVNPADSRTWGSMGVSTDGTKMFQCVNGGICYVSTDSGQSWTPKFSDSNRAWWASAASADGRYMATQGHSTSIQVSADYGNTWNSYGPVSSWEGISVSADGSRMVAIQYSGNLYTSSDYGQTWNVSTAGVKGWVSVDSSADGKHIVAGVLSGYIYTSDDYGVTWNERSSSGGNQWRSVQVSNDGKYIVAGDFGSQMHYSSDFGVTWSNVAPTGGGWCVLYMSADGSTIMAYRWGSSDYPYISRDRGVTWEQHTEIGTPFIYWSGTGSPDGTMIFVGSASANSNLYKATSITTNDDLGTIIRKYVTNTTPVRDFTLNSGRWIVEAYNSVINLAGSTYSTLTNIFKAFTNSIFTPDPTVESGINVVPQVSVATTTAGTVIKWLPRVTWDNASTCEYKLDDGEYTALDCSKNGTDIPRPTAGAHTLYVKGTDTKGNLSEKVIPFTYDNVSPVWTTCGTDLLDEATRQYYYLASDITGTCTATVNAELRGNISTSTTGYTLTGDVEGNGHNIILQNITITGSVYSNGAVAGAAGGSISIYFATTTAVFSNGNDGGPGGHITIATSTTGAITANGANSAGNGGNGGIIDIWNSDGAVASTTVTANGGNSVGCGNGGDAGIITITNSNNYVAISIPGVACNNSCGSGGGVHTDGQTHDPIVIVRPPVIIPPVVPPTPVPSSGGGGSVWFPDLNPIGKLTLKDLPKINNFFGQNSLGDTNFGNILEGVKSPGVLKLPDLKAVSFEKNLTNFLFTDLPESIRKQLNASPKLADYFDLHKAQDLIKIKQNPLVVSGGGIGLPGLYEVFVSTSKQRVTLTTDDKYKKLQLYVRAAPNAPLSIKLVPISKAQVKSQFLNKNVIFTKADGKNIKTEIIAPKTPACYTFTTSASPIELIIDVVAPSKPVIEVKSPWYQKLFRLINTII
jgi:Concanavalin A-like lectin/glucanases superfamily